MQVGQANQKGDFLGMQFGNADQNAKFLRMQFENDSSYAISKARFLEKLFGHATLTLENATLNNLVPLNGYKGIGSLKNNFCL